MELPRCGIYRTTEPLAGREDAVPAGRLIFFHSHSQQGWPIVLMPDRNERNRWTFHQRGYLVREVSWTSTLEALKAEGLYRVREHLHLGSEQVLARDALAQLGYNREAEPILFFPQASQEENALYFPDRGTKIPPEIYALLEPLDTRGPHVPGVKHLH